MTSHPCSSQRAGTYIISPYADRLADISEDDRKIESFLKDRGRLRQKHTQ